jgi:hypothetical protein
MPLQAGQVQQPKAIPKAMKYLALQLWLDTQLADYLLATNVQGQRVFP